MHSKYMQSLRIDNRKVRRNVNPAGGRRFLVLFLLVLALVGGMIFSGWVRWKQTESVYRINRIREQKAALEEERKKLLMELYRLQSLERADHIARAELGMLDVPPEHLIGVQMQREEDLADTGVAANSGTAGGERR